MSASCKASRMRLLLMFQSSGESVLKLGDLFHLITSQQTERQCITFMIDTIWTYLYMWTMNLMQHDLRYRICRSIS